MSQIVSILKKTKVKLPGEDIAPVVVQLSYPLWTPGHRPVYPSPSPSGLSLPLWTPGHCPVYPSPSPSGLSIPLALPPFISLSLSLPVICPSLCSLSFPY